VWGVEDLGISGMGGHNVAPGQETGANQKVTRANKKVSESSKEGTKAV